MSDEISDLRLFNRIVAYESLSEAARQLNRSLPSISRRLAALESRLGVRLIDRGSRRFALTLEGSLYYQRGSSLIADLDALEAETGQSAIAPRGLLRLSAPSEIGRHRIAPLLSQLSKQYEDLSVDLLLTEETQDVLDGSLDLALQFDPPSNGNVIARHLLSSHLIACASPAYLKEHGPLTNVAELRNRRCIVLRRGHQIYDHWQFWEGETLHSVRVPPSLICSNAEVVHDWILMGRGIGIKLRCDIEKNLQRGDLVDVLPNFRGIKLDLHAVYATKTYLPLRMRVALDHLIHGLTEPS